MFALPSTAGIYWQNWDWRSWLDRYLQSTSEKNLMKKIMIVDDDVETTTILESILKLAGYEPVSVNDSTIAVQTASLVHPNLFLLDLMMPVLDGFKLCMALRETQEFSRTPIIIITALDNTDSRVVAFGAGATDYITKPYLPKDLVIKIKDYLIE
jgi:DNA-binding response OmpR family regulator